MNRSKVGSSGGAPLRSALSSTGVAPDRLFQSAPQEPSGNCHRHIPQRVNLNAQGPATLVEVLLYERVQILGPKHFFVPRDLRTAGENIYDGRIPCSQNGQQLLSDTISHVAGIQIARILLPALPAAPEPVQDILSARIQQRANQPVLSSGINGCHAAISGPSQHPLQDRFRLVVGSMADSNSVGPAGFDQREEIVVAKLAGGLFQISPGMLPARIRGCRLKRQVQPFGKVTDEQLILIGFHAAPLVVEVRNRKGAAQFRGKLLQDEE